MKKLILFISFFTFTFSLSSLHAQIINLYGGNGSNGFSGDGGPATAADLGEPYHVITDASGTLYEADRTNNRVRMISSSGTISTLAGNGVAGFSGDGGPATAAEMSYPLGVGIDNSGNVYISDHSDYHIRMVNTSGIISTVAGNGSATYSGDGGPATAAGINAIGVTFDNAGNLIIADSYNNRVRKVNSSGIIVTIAGNGAGGFGGDGGQATAALVSSPDGVRFDAAGNLYIADCSNCRIRMINTNGIITTVAGTGVAGYSGDGGQATAAQIQYPTSVAVDNAGNIYFTDWMHNVLRVVNSSGIINTYAGNGTGGYSGDGGPAASAELRADCGVTIDANGDIYIGDTDNNRVRKISTPLAVSNVQFNDNSAVVYPNPNKGVFTIESSVVSHQSSVEIFNVFGQKIYSTPVSNLNTQIQIDLGKQPAGIYIYKIKDSNGKQVSAGKFIIE